MILSLSVSSFRGYEHNLGYKFSLASIIVGKLAVAQCELQCFRNKVSVILCSS